MDATQATGRTYQAQINYQKPLDTERLLEPSKVLLTHQPSVAIALIYILDKPYYQLTSLNFLIMGQGIFLKLDRGIHLLQTFPSNKILFGKYILMM
jgi:hypothetical protein